MNMNPFLETLVSHLTDALFSPKDHFERVKGRATKMLVVPLITIVGAESAFVTFLGAVSSLEVHSGNVFFRFAGSSSDSFLMLSGVVFLSFLSVVGSNLYYARHLKKAQTEIKLLSKKALLSASYAVLKAKFGVFVAEKKLEEAYSVASLMFNRFPEYVDEDPDFLQSLLSSNNLEAIRQLQSLVPTRPALSAGAAASTRLPNPIGRADG